MLHQLTIEEASDGLRAGKFSSAELTEDVFKRIKSLNPSLNAYVTLCEESALARAREVDSAGFKGKSLLAGVPAGLKDIFNTAGVRTTCCSNIIKDFVPPYNATVVGMLDKAGMVMAGKLNMDEFACGGSTEHSSFGVCKNPWDLERVSGGSSGGSASAVASDMAFYALGTDTGGSIRQPASFCGCVGLKVTYGRVSRSGVTAMASSWDTIGPLTKTVRDAGIVLGEIAGRDVRDSTTPDVAVPDYLAGIEDGVKGMRIGVPKEYFMEGLNPEVEKAVRSAIEVYRKAGAVIKEVSLPYTKYALAVYYVSMPAELSANLARFDGIRFGSAPSGGGLASAGAGESGGADAGAVKDLIDYYYKVRSEGFGDEIKRRIMIGTYVLSAGYYDAYYRKAQKVRTLIIEDFARVFKEVEVLVTPVAPTPAFKIGEKADSPLDMYLADIFTLPVSCAGLPALSVPCGFTEGGLPVGMQLVGAQFSEPVLLKVGRAYERAMEWGKKKPGV